MQVSTEVTFTSDEINEMLNEQLEKIGYRLDGVVEIEPITVRAIVSNTIPLGIKMYNNTRVRTAEERAEHARTYAREYGKRRRAKLTQKGGDVDDSN